MKKIAVLFSVAALGSLAGCDDAKPATASQYHCNAAYVVESNGRICEFGRCPRYDDILRDRYCPSVSPLCILDADRRYYCGTECPEGTHPVLSPKTFESACEPDAVPVVCTPEKCLSEKGHENWAKAECTDDGSCKLVSCRDGYALKNGTCVPALNCCGESCVDCPKSEGWKSGECRDGVCVPDRCVDGYVLSEREDGTAVCALKVETGCMADDDCPERQVCDVETGLCVCGAGFEDCGDGCYDLSSDVNHCGACETACSAESGAGICQAGKCQFSCEPGYLVSSFGLGCVKDGGPCTIPGKYRTDSERDIVVYYCNDDLRWETFKTCYSNSGTGGIFWGGEDGDDCTTICQDDYIQNADLTDCDYKGGPCTEGEYRCNNTWGKGEHYVCHNNQWEIVKTCVYDDRVEDMTCTPQDSCRLVCALGYKLNPEENECVFDTDAACTTGETRCGGASFGRSFQRCVDGHWTLVEECELEGLHGGGMYCDDNDGCHYWCNSGNVLCGNACADFQNDVDHCGSCEISCDSGLCVNGTCR